MMRVVLDCLKLPQYLSTTGQRHRVACQSEEVVMTLPPPHLYALLPPARLMRSPPFFPPLPHAAATAVCFRLLQAVVHTGMLEQGAEPGATVGGHAGGWRLVSPVSALIKYSCSLCWFREDTVGQETEQEEKQGEEEVEVVEESISQRSCEVQELQKEVQQGTGELQELQSQRCDVQDSLNELVLQKGSLEQQLGHIREQCSQESQLILSLQAEHEEHQHQIEQYMEELARAREELRRLQDEARCAEERVKETQAQLRPLQDSICDSHADVQQLQQKLKELQIKEKDVSTLPAEEMHQKEELELLSNEEGDQKEEPGVEVDSEMKGEGQLDLEKEKEQKTLEGKKNNYDIPADPDSHTAPTCCLQDTEDGNSSSPVPEITEVQQGNQKPLISDVSKEVQFAEDDEGSESDEPSKPQQESAATASVLDFFHSDPFIGSDPFKDDLFGKTDHSDLFSRDPFKGTDPFSEEAIFKDPPSDLFTSADPTISVDADPFTCQQDRAEDVHFLFQKDHSNATEMDTLSFTPNSSNVHDLFTFQSNLTPHTDPFVAILPTQGSVVEDMASAFGDPFAPGDTALNTCSNPDVFSAVFESESFSRGFADFSQLSKSSSVDSSQSSGTHDGDKSPTVDGHPHHFYVSTSIPYTEGTLLSPWQPHTGKPSTDSPDPFDWGAPPLPPQLGDLPLQLEEMSFHDSFSVSPYQLHPGDPQNVTGSECVSTTLPSPSPPEMQ
ncbi:epidermal growth factor receptor substrate 15-like [Arapaima gigas]